ncbi:aspartyl/asparaginyl beta-hydroxylase domain-containing protein [Pseudoxanthomonas mexicana]|uniref:aspartyl/asparaginyl beta-hydroxylase domain-containing protein n=2 Tax=Gammaproteobacteria TaxID=1236 RepID=UPI000780F953|nr:aspartyl/asparaginyl beta-hydroxylase domain-containing protein [Pseudoxanthomonas mexicana]
MSPGTLALGVIGLYAAASVAYLYFYLYVYRRRGRRRDAGFGEYLRARTRGPRIRDEALALALHRNGDIAATGQPESAGYRGPGFRASCTRGWKTRSLRWHGDPHAPAFGHPPGLSTPNDDARSLATRVFAAVAPWRTRARVPRSPRRGVDVLVTYVVNTLFLLLAFLPVYAVLQWIRRAGIAAVY